MSTFAVAREEWLALGTGLPNALLIGPDRLVDDVLERLAPKLRPPVTVCSSAALVLPADRKGTLVLRDAGHLSEREQAALLRWLDDAERRVQTIATSPFALWPLVERGVLADTLYYRLNVLTICLDRPGPHAV